VYLHFWAEGPEEQIAIRMHQALTLTGTPLQKDTSEKEASSIDALPAERIQALLGRKGTVKDGVLSVAVPRSQPIRMHDVELPPSIGMATAINIQAGQNGKIAATGDFVLMATEVPAGRSSAHSEWHTGDGPAQSSRSWFARFIFCSFSGRTMPSKR
jgi:hypothetical protein